MLLQGSTSLDQASKAFSQSEEEDKEELGRMVPGARSQGHGRQRLLNTATNENAPVQPYVAAPKADMCT